MDARANPLPPNKSAALARRSLMVSLLVMLLTVLAGLHVSWSGLDQRLATIRAIHDIAALDTGMQAHLQTGLPLSDFAGFNRISDDLLRVSREVAAIAVRNPEGAVIRQASRVGYQASFPQLTDGIPVDLKDGRQLLLQSDSQAMRLALPLENNLEQAGSLQVEVLHPWQHTFEPVYFLVLYLCAAGLLGITAVFLYGVATDGEVRKWHRSFGPCCLLFAPVALLAIVFLLVLTENRASETAGAIAGSFGARINQAMDLGISPEDLSGLDQIVLEMHNSDDIIAYVALIEGNQVTTASGLPEDALLSHVADLPLTAIHELRPRQIYQRQYQVATGLQVPALAQMGLRHSWPLYLSFLILPLLLGAKLLGKRGREYD